MIKKLVKSSNLLVTGSLLAITALIGSGAVSACSSNQDLPGDSQGASKIGSVGLQITLPSGAQISEVTFIVSGGGLTSSRTGTIPVASDLATVSALIGALPAATGYTISLQATSTDGTTNCLGSANFDIEAGQTTGVTVPLICDSDTTRGNVNVNTVINVCPVITSIVVAPLQTGVGSIVALTSSASDANVGDHVTYAWTATDGGTFVDGSSANTTYNCTVPGPHTLTLTVSDDGAQGSNCDTAQSVDIVCVATAVCGDGNAEHDKGEQCDPPDGLTCSDNCQNIVANCGNGHVEGTEQCDSTDRSVCNADCTSVVCGDGHIQGNEQCEPPDQLNCGHDCKTLPPVCGNGVTELGEDCDDSNVVSGDGCSSTCHTENACDTCAATPCNGALTAKATACTGGACDAYDACVASSKCADTDSRNCYCGSIPFATCFDPATDPATPNGACKTQITTLAGTTNPLQVGAKFFDATTPIGADNQVLLCEHNNCSSACFPVDQCTQCLSTNCPGPVANQQTVCAGGACDAYQTCLNTTHCGNTDVRTCYCGTVAFTDCFDVFADPATPNGVCKSQITALAATTNPLQVGTKFFTATGTLGAVNQTVLCEDNNCRTPANNVCQ